MDGREAEAVNDHRALELERLDALQAGLWGRAVSGDVKAVNAVLRIIEQRSLGACAGRGCEGPARVRPRRSRWCSAAVLNQCGFGVREGDVWVEGTWFVEFLGCPDWVRTEALAEVDALISKYLDSCAYEVHATRLPL